MSGLQQNGLARSRWPASIERWTESRFGASATACESMGVAGRWSLNGPLNCSGAEGEDCPGWGQILVSSPNTTLIDLSGVRDSFHNSKPSLQVGEQGGEYTCDAIESI